MSRIAGERSGAHKEEREQLIPGAKRGPVATRRCGAAAVVLVVAVVTVAAHYVVRSGELGPWTESGFARLRKTGIAGPDSALWGDSSSAPYPTGAWWLNSVLSDEASSPATPYQILTGANGVVLSYSSRRRVVSRDAQVDQFGVDWVAVPWSDGVLDERLAEVQRECCNDSYVAAGDLLLMSSPETPRRILEHSHLGVVFRYEPGLRVAVVKASPLATFEIEDGASAAFAPGGAAGGRIREVTRRGPNAFVIELTDESRWLLVVDAEADFGEGGLVVSGPAAARLGAAPSEADLQVLLASCPTTFARGGDVLFGEDGRYSLRWRTAVDEACPRLALLAQRHHLQTLSSPAPSANASGFVGSKGRMHWVVASDHTWELHEPLYAEVSASSSSSSFEVTNETRRALIAEQARRDLDSWRGHPTEQARPEAYGFVYFEGKELARLARLAEVAADAGDAETARDATTYLRRRFERFLRRDDVLAYDPNWGGIIASEGAVGDPFADFGNALYSDHHFHYGYYAYAAAVLASRTPLWTRRWRRRLEALVLDFANFPASRETRFPLARHKDWYESHSWATGLVVYATGKSQESSSEAAHAYAAAALYGEAVGDARLAAHARLMAATEIRGAQTYWHMHPNERIYDREFAANRMAGSVAGAAVSAATWFGSNPEYVHGINVLPVLAGLTDVLFKPSFVCQQLPVLLRALDRPSPPVSQAWRGVVLADLAVAQPARAWARALRLDPDQFDDGNSKANLLHYLNLLLDTYDDAACDPSDFVLDDDDYEDLPSTLKGVQPACSDNLACVALGLDGLCCPQDDGYVFGCCPVLKPADDAAAADDVDDAAP